MTRIIAPDTVNRRFMARDMLSLLGVKADIPQASKNVDLPGPVNLAVHVLLLGVIQRFHARVCEILKLDPETTMPVFVRVLTKTIVAYLTSAPQLFAPVLTRQERDLIALINRIAAEQHLFMLVRSLPPTVASFYDTFYVRILPSWRVTTALGYIFHEGFYSNLPIPSQADISGNRPFVGSAFEMELPHHVLRDGNINCRHVMLRYEGDPFYGGSTILEWWLETARPDVVQSLVYINVNSDPVNVLFGEHNSELEGYDYFATRELILDATHLSSGLADATTRRATVTYLQKFMRFLEKKEDEDEKKRHTRFERVTLVLPTFTAREDLHALTGLDGSGIMDKVRGDLHGRNEHNLITVSSPSALNTRSYFIRISGALSVPFAFNHMCMAVFVTEDATFSFKGMAGISAVQHSDAATAILPRAYLIDVLVPNRHARERRGTRRLFAFVLSKSLYEKDKLQFVKLSDALHAHWKTLPEFEKSMPVGVFGSSPATEQGMCEFIVTDLRQQQVDNGEVTVVTAFAKSFPDALTEDELNRIAGDIGIFARDNPRDESVWTSKSHVIEDEEEKLPRHPTSLLPQVTLLADDAGTCVLVFDSALTLTRTNFYPLVEMKFPIAMTKTVTSPLFRPNGEIRSHHNVKEDYKTFMSIARTDLLGKFARKTPARTVHGEVSRILFETFPLCLRTCATAWVAQGSPEWSEFRVKASHSLSEWAEAITVPGFAKNVKHFNEEDTKTFKDFTHRYAVMCFNMCFSDPQMILDSHDERFRKPECYEIEQMMSEATTADYYAYPAVFTRSYEFSDKVELTVSGRRVVKKKP